MRLNRLFKSIFQDILAESLRLLERPKQIANCATTLNINPILTLGKHDAWDSSYASWASVTYDGTLWRMYYSGKDKCGHIRIGLAFSEQGLKWKKYLANPILDVGSGKSWDALYVYCPIVWKEKTSWKMIYTGCNTSDKLHFQIGLAESQDGISWTKYNGNPVFNSDHDWDLNKRQNHETEGWGLLIDNSQYYLFYNPVSRKPRQVGVAQSSDLVSWKSLSSYPLLPSEGLPWDLSYMKYCVCPFKIEGKFYLLVSMSDKYYIKSKIGLYRLVGSLPSLEGLEFLGYILETSEKWCKKELDTPFVVCNPSGDKLMCYYGGRSIRNEWTLGLALINIFEPIRAACMS